MRLINSNDPTTVVVLDDIPIPLITPPTLIPPTFIIGTTCSD